MVGFNVPKEARAVPAPDEMPLLQTGPGGEYGRAYYGRGRRLLATAPLPNLHEAGSFRVSTLVVEPTTWFERIMGLVHGQRTRTPDRSSDLQRLATTCRRSNGLKTDRASLVDYFSDRTSTSQPELHTTRVTYHSPESSHESHAEATVSPAAHSRIETRAGLFPDDAGTRRSTRRQQGHGLRTRRRTRTKRNRQARAEQGSLFVNL